jgi:serine/threonine protein kinase
MSSSLSVSLRHDLNAMSIGTPYFSAPECFHEGAHISSKADIWSAGAILYYMTYGQEPLESSSQPPADVSRTSSSNVDSILRGCLQWNTRDRRNHQWLANHPYTANPLAL